MTTPCSDNTQAKQIQRERAGSASSGNAPDNVYNCKEPPEPGTDSDRDESDSEDDDIATLLRPPTPSYNPVNRSGPAPDDVAIARGRVNYTPMAGLPMPNPEDIHPPLPNEPQL